MSEKKPPEKNITDNTQTPPEINIPAPPAEKSHEKKQTASWFKTALASLLKSDPRHILTTGFLTGFVSCSALISLACLYLFGNLSLSIPQTDTDLSSPSDTAISDSSSILTNPYLPQDERSSILNNPTASGFGQNSVSSGSSGAGLSMNNSSSSGTDKYLRTDLLWTGRQGYLLGNYLPAYAMNLRMEPLTDADEAGQVAAFETVNIVEIAEGLEESVWGRTDKGPWILLQDKETIYCFGPGEYEAIDPLAILSNSGQEVSQLRSQQRFFADQIFTQNGAIFGILSDGNQVVLWNQVSTVDR